MAIEYATLALLFAAACHDVVTRTIPDVISILLLVVAGWARLVEGPFGLVLSAGTALILLVPLLIARSYAAIGGGDVKLMAAVAVGLPPFESCSFVIATAIAGGLLALVYVLLSPLVSSVPTWRRRSLVGRVLAIELWRIRRRGPLPYAVAIAAGGAFVLLHPGSF